jgi:hypothetical protein
LPTRKNRAVCRFRQDRCSGLRKTMKQLLEELRAALPAAFERDDYRARRDVIDQQFKSRNEQSFGELQRRAEQKALLCCACLWVWRWRHGETAKSTSELFEALPERQRERMQRDIEEIQVKLEV